MKVSPKAMLRPVAFQVMSWGFDILALFIIFASLGYAVGLDKVIITNTLVVSLQTQGVALDDCQIVSSPVYMVLGISPFLAITTSLLAGFASFWFKVTVSFLAFQRTIFAKRIPILTSTGPTMAIETYIEEQKPALLTPNRHLPT